MDLQLVSSVIMTGLLRGGLFALTATGLSLVLGVMNITNFAHGEFTMIGAYVTYFALVSFGLAPHWAILVAAVLSFVAGVLFEKILIRPLWLRTKEEWLTNTFLVTAGLSFVLQNIAQAIWGGRYFGASHFWEGKVDVLPGTGVSIDRIVGFLIAIVVIIAFWLFLQKTKPGKAMRAAAQDEQGAMLVGIDLEKTRTLTLGLSGMLAGIAGACLLPINPAFPNMGQLWLNKSWFVVILVGLGNIGAAIPGGFIVGMLESISYYFLSAGWQEVLSLSLLTLILVIKPSGIFGSEVKGALER